MIIICQGSDIMIILYIIEETIKINKERKNILQEKASKNIANECMREC